jgi:hypothetical protein
MLGALIATSTAFAYASPPFMAHGEHRFAGGGSSAYPRVSMARAVSVSVPRNVHYGRNDTRGGFGDQQRLHAAAPNRVAVANEAPGSLYTGKADGYTVQRMVIPGDAYRGRPSAQFGGVQYAGAITPVSTDSHTAPRPPANAQSAHVGSIRDDVARYNEERGASRPIPRQSGDSSRIPGPSPYRN